MPRIRLEAWESLDDVEFNDPPVISKLKARCSKLQGGRRHDRPSPKRRPGDRANTCRSLMAPVGAFHRPNSEQVIVHRCLGCGVERHCRVAADDNVLACLRLPLVPPRSGTSRRHADGSTGEKAIA